MLHALAGGLCQFPGCGEPSVQDGSVVGDVAHICGLNPGSARHDSSLDDEEVNSTDNLILLCLKHHKIVDDHEDEYPRELLAAWKETPSEPIDPRVFARVIDAVFAEVLDEWWFEPGAPDFSLIGLSTTKGVPPWTFRADLRQVAGDDVTPQGRFRGCGALSDLAELERTGQPGERKWRVPSIHPTTDGTGDDPELAPGELALEWAFYWRGAWRHVMHSWSSPAACGEAAASLRRWTEA